MEVWQTSRELTHLIYEWTRNEMFSRDYGLCDQMRRASVSIMSNIAEGFESRTNLLFKDFLGRAKASAGELRAQAYIAQILVILVKQISPSSLVYVRSVASKSVVSCNT